MVALKNCAEGVLSPSSAIRTRGWCEFWQVGAKNRKDASMACISCLDHPSNLMKQSDGPDRLRRKQLLRICPAKTNTLISALLYGEPCTVTRRARHIHTFNTHTLSMKLLLGQDLSRRLTRTPSPSRLHLIFTAGKTLVCFIGALC